ncbi:hypothetical protein [Pseudorhodoferax sp. Leaf267]|nr:hypothetical protein [Pseudorhodoferax sp. Leaf267]
MRDLNHDFKLLCQRNWDGSMTMAAYNLTRLRTSTQVRPPYV